MTHLEGMRSIILTTIRNRIGCYIGYPPTELIAKLAFDEYAKWYRSQKSKDISQKTKIDKLVLFIKEAETPWLSRE